MTIREATQSDVGDIVRLSRRARAELERYEPTFWRPHEEAEKRQQAWFSVLVEEPAHLVLVDAEDHDIKGFVIARAADAPPVYDPGGRTCIIDDFVWDRDAGADELLDRVTIWAAAHRCVQLIIVSAVADDERKSLLKRRGLHAVSEWWSTAIV